MIEIPFPDKPSATCRKIKALSPILNIDKGPWVAGGSVRRVLIDDYADEHDIDIFYSIVHHKHVSHCLKREFGRSNGEECQTTILRKVLGEDTIMKRIFGKPFHIDEKPVVQFTSRNFSTPEELLASIDFTVCQFVTDGRVIRHSSTAMADLLYKRLSLRNEYNTIDRETYLARVFKYMSYGYTPTLQVLERAANSKPHYDELIPQFKKMEATEYDITEDDLEPHMTLSKIGGIIMTSIRGKDWVFMNGLPYPANLGFVSTMSMVNRQKIQFTLQPLWQKLKLDTDKNKMNLDVFSKKYIDEYRAFHSNGLITLETST